MATDFTANDIKTAVASATTTVLGGSERKALATDTYAAHKAGAGVLTAFKSAWPKASALLTPAIEKAFDAAVQAAKKERLDAKAVTTGTAPEKTPDEMAREASKAVRKLSGPRGSLRTAKKAAQGHTDQDIKDALGIVVDAVNAATAAAEVTVEAAEVAANHPDTDAAKEAANATSAAFQLVNEAIEEAADGLEDLKTLVSEAEGAKRTAKANKAKKRSKAKEAKEKSFVNREVKPRGWVIVAISIALAALWFATINGLPWKLPAIGLVAIAAIALYAALMPPETGRVAAVGIAAIMLVAAGAVFIFYDGSDGKSANGGNITVNTHTVDLSQYEDAALGNEAAEPMWWLIIAIAVVAVAATGVWLYRRRSNP